MPLIAFEGLDQSGKETQARRLRGQLESAGRRVAALTFPSDDTPIAREIRTALEGGRDYAADVMQLLFIANRHEHRPQIEQWLQDDVVVICDRYLASTIAYGEALGLDPRWLSDTQRKLPQPDLTVLLDIRPETALARKHSGRDRYERDLALLARVRESYRRQAGASRWALVDGEQSREAVEETISAAVRARLGLPLPR
jgi:dTMP kinase